MLISSYPSTIFGTNWGSLELGERLARKVEEDEEGQEEEGKEATANGGEEEEDAKEGAN